MTRPFHLPFLLGLVFLYQSCSYQQDTGSTQLISDPHKLDKYLTDLTGIGAYPFIYARLEDDKGDVIYEHGSVNEDILPGKKVDGKTWIRIWSMSKIVTISIALDLMEDGLLSLNDPVIKYIPEFKNLQVATSKSGGDLSQIKDKESLCPLNFTPMDSVMTVSHLINHKAGFYYAVTGIECLDSLEASKNLATSENNLEFINRLAELPLIQQPGTNYFYGINTTVLGFVAERASGKSLSQLVKDRVTDPMNITGLRYGLPEGARLFPRFSGKDSVLREAYEGELDIFGPDVPDYNPNHKLFLGGEGMLATADGYADFLRMLLNRGSLNGYRFLDESTVEDIISPHTQTDNPGSHNGYNLWITSDSSRIDGVGSVELWIGGGYESTHFWIDPERGFVGVIMSQMYWVPERGWGRDDKFRGELYSQIFKNE